MDKKELIDKGESQNLEFKESFRLKEEIGETVSAFSNSDGGVVLVGIFDSGEPIGVDIGGNTLEELANHIKRNTDPQIFPTVKIQEVSGKKVVMIEVRESQEKPVFFKNHAYKRVGKTNQMISSSEVRKLAKESGERVYWDEQICEDASLDDIEEEKVRWFLKEARKQRGLKISEDAPVEEALMKLKLLRNGELTNAAILLFFKELTFLQSEVKCIRFSGNEPVKPYIDFQTIEGTVFDLVDGAEDFVLRNIKKSIWLVPGQLQREERYEYPPDAIREAIVNAVVHRDYESPSKVQVRVFDDRIEVWNPGLLPEGITLEDLKREHRSIPRNPLLFRQLFWVKYVEDVGGGTLDMIKWCKEWGLPEPDFKFITGA
ncbi:MAG: putative DNA binding domain-containing protein, partial [Methanophagales archaeon]|nr:putative DNA binding domain-containing protein [Methanophagales archaeon]